MQPQLLWPHCRSSAGRSSRKPCKLPNRSCRTACRSPSSPSSDDDGNHPKTTNSAWPFWATAKTSAGNDRRPQQQQQQQLPQQHSMCRDDAECRHSGTGIGPNKLVHVWHEGHIHALQDNRIPLARYVLVTHNKDVKDEHQGVAKPAQTHAVLWCGLATTLFKATFFTVSGPVQIKKEIHSCKIHKNLVLHPT